MVGRTVCLNFPVDGIDSRIGILNNYLPWTGCCCRRIIDHKSGLGELKPSGAVTHDGCFWTGDFQLCKCRMVETPSFEKGGDCIYNIAATLHIARRRADEFVAL